MPGSDYEEETGASSGGIPSGRSTVITSELRTDWKTILKTTKVNKAHQARLSQLAIITVLVKRLGNFQKGI